MPLDREKRHIRTLGSQVLHGQKAIELLLGEVQGLQHGHSSQVPVQALPLHRRKLPMMAAHQAQEPAVLAPSGVSALPQLQKC